MSHQISSSDCDVEVTSQLWDLYLVNQDPWIIFFMVTVMLVNFRDNIIEVAEDRYHIVMSSEFVLCFYYLLPTNSPPEKSFLRDFGDCQAR